MMFAKYITAALAGTALLATVASAQTPTTTIDRADTASANTAMTLSDSSLQGDWRASKVVGLAVYNDNNDSVGTINDLLMDKSGNIKAVVLGVGGFLGVGEHLVAVPFDKVKFVDTRVPRSPPQAAIVQRHRPLPVRPRRVRARQSRTPIFGIPITPCSTRPRMN
jgi:sporulation protein YlmC with PRC-barrel domain